MTVHRLGILSRGPRGNDTDLTLDGQPLHGVRSLRIEMGVGRLNTVHLELRAEVDAAVLADSFGISVRRQSWWRRFLEALR